MKAKKGINLMKKEREKETKDFMEKIGLPLFKELTEIDRKDNRVLVETGTYKKYEYQDIRDLIINSPTKTQWLELEKLVPPDKLLKKKK